jgi:hypothetical protein
MQPVIFYVCLRIRLPGLPDNSILHCGQPTANGRRSLHLATIGR